MFFSSFETVLRRVASLADGGVPRGVVIPLGRLAVQYSVAYVHYLMAEFLSSCWCLSLRKGVIIDKSILQCPHSEGVICHLGVLDSKFLAAYFTMMSRFFRVASRIFLTRSVKIDARCFDNVKVAKELI